MVRGMVSYSKDNQVLLRIGPARCSSPTTYRAVLLAYRSGTDAVRVQYGLCEHRIRRLPELPRGVPVPLARLLPVPNLFFLTCKSPAAGVRRGLISCRLSMEIHRENEGCAPGDPLWLLNGTDTLRPLTYMSAAAAAVSGPKLGRSFGGSGYRRVPMREAGTGGESGPLHDCSTGPVLTQESSHGRQCVALDNRAFLCSSSYWWRQPQCGKVHSINSRALSPACRHYL
jgi:hypothetical protein